MHDLYYWSNGIKLCDEFFICELENRPIITWMKGLIISYLAFYSYEFSSKSREDPWETSQTLVWLISKYWLLWQYFWTLLLFKSREESITSLLKK